jgi:hypothetical protein
VQAPLPFRLHNRKLYRIRMDVRGDGFTTYIDGQVVDFFRDKRLTTGGVGIFCRKSDRARVRWIGLMHQYDFLGRLCALVAPYQFDDPPRSANP